MVVVAELILSSFITVLFAKLTSPELLNFLSREGIDTQLKKWSKTLIKIQAVLNDAEDKQITNQAVQLWLDDLQDLAYDLDDLLDEFASEALRSKLIMELEAQPQPQPQPQQPDEYDHHQATSTTSKLVLRKLLFPTCCTSFTPRAIWFNSNMRTKIDDITSRFDDISKTKNDLDLKESHTVRIGSRSSNRVRERLPTTSLPESHVYGREEDKGAILERLLTTHEASDDGLIVIPIQGMGGVGKTTLAQELYNDDRVNGWFDAKAWACVSDDFDIFRVTKTILESFTENSCDFKDLNMLQVRLKEKLLGKKFLLVLDDLWNENYEEWDVLRRPFLAGAVGSRVIVTTRNGSVASITGTLSGSTYHLKQLSNEDCLSLFAQHALGRENFGEHPNLKAMGEEIVKRCKGLPLAAKTLGGLLRTKLEQSDWEDILNSKIWDLPKQRTGILPALHLSYHHLPSHLKRCFAYCSIFPKDYEFDKDELVLLWMAEGFLQPSEGKKRLMDFGRKCFDDLLSRSLFQQSSSKTLKSELKFVMHDLLNDLAEYVARGICFRLDNDGQHEVSKRARHSSFTRQKYEVFQRFKPLHKVQRLRTFLPLPVHKLDFWREYHLTSQVLVDLLPKLQCLRVLSLSGYSINELPDAIGNLKHLRYLDLSQTSIKNLPESVSTLYNLQTLSLSSCKFLCKLPSKIGNLINLHCLDIAETQKLQEMPSGICKLTSLQTLSKIVLGTSNGPRLRELRDLSLLCGKLSIEGLQNVMDISDAEAANLKSKHMDGLVMEWSSNFNDRQNSQLDMDLLDKLRPHQCLESLEIKFYWGMEFPSWIGDPTFSQITKISLQNCGKCTSLPTLGQLPLLRNLVIQGMYEVKRVGEEFYKLNDGPSLELPFPLLETLCFENMLEWEEWFSFAGKRQLPCLRELKISSCPKLNRVPLLSLPTLRVLQLKHCDKVMLKSVVNLTSLTELTIGRISDLTCLPKEFMEGLVALQYMRVENWDELVTLWENGVELENLVRLDVLNCQKLVSLVGEEEQGLPRKLQILSIRNCANLEKIPNVFKRLTCLRPSTLTSLQLSGPKALESLPDGKARLRYLNITGHSGQPTRYISHGIRSGLEMTQKVCIVTLGIKCSSSTDRPNIGTLLGSVQTTFSNLRCLLVVSCDGIESFPELTSFSTPNLRELVIMNCKNLKLLCDQIHSLTSLVSLEIRECPSLDSFPQRDLPPNLRTLQISECEKLRPLSEWGLHRLTSLLEFRIEGEWPELVSFPGGGGGGDDDDCLLFPPSLTRLYIGSFLNLKTLASLRHQNLTSLRELYIRKCPELRSLPQADLLLPLLRLDIEECPHLTQRCLNDKCDYWTQISHIPCLQIFQGVSDSERRSHYTDPWW